MIQKYITIKQAQLLLYADKPLLVEVLKRNIQQAVNLLPKGQLKLEL